MSTCQTATRFPTSAPARSWRPTRGLPPTVQPLLRAMPEDILQLSAPHILSHHLCVEACRTRSLEPARRAFLASPLLTASLRDANALFDEMVRGTRAYLGQYAIV